MQSWWRFMIGVICGTGWLALPFRSAAEDLSIRHEPPIWSGVPGAAERGLPITMSISGGLRARLLVRAPLGGYRIVTLSRQEEDFKGDLPIETGHGERLSAIRYHFQVELADGAVFESPSYIVVAPGNDPVISLLQERVRGLIVRTDALETHRMIATGGKTVDERERGLLASANLRLIELLRARRSRARNSARHQGEGA